MMKVAPHEPRTLKWWYEQYLNDRLDMAPYYQRKSYIWGKWKQAHLIDSLLNGFDIPKFYVANFLELPSKKLNKARKPYAIIDGKQRLQAVFDYLGDRLVLNQSVRIFDYPDVRVDGLHCSEVRVKYPELAAMVDNFIPVVMNVVADSEDFIEELFVRLNSGEAANGAERRNAMGGPVPALVRELVLHPFLANRVRFNKNRMQDFNLATKLLLIEFKGGFADVKLKNLNDFAIQARDQERSGTQQELLGGAIDPKDYGKARDRVIKTMDHMASIFRERDLLLSAQGHIPVYYWLVREYPEESKWFREFLSEFTSALTANLRLERSRPDDGDRELSLYYTYGRSTNDQASLEGRYKILLRRFRRFLRERAE